MKKLFYILISLPLVAALGVLTGESRNFTPDQKLLYTERIISDYYVDTVNDDKIAEAGIRRMLEELDPHSQYSNAEETRELNEPLAGNFSGVGITFNMNRDTLYVIQPVAGGPSERVGIMAGDRIIAVNDTTVAGVKMKSSDIQKRLRGPKGTKVDVRVLRRAGGAPDTIDFRITRADIPIHSIDAAYMVDPKTGYIRITRFSADTGEEFRKAVKTLDKQGMQQLILDLTGNGGGYLNAAVEILGEMLDPGRMAVYTEGRNSPRYDHLAHPAGRTPLLAGKRLVVMADQSSASASEITAGAIQDWDRGVIVGRRTFGKGLVQRPFPFPDGSMIRLTIAHYYTPTGRDIQRPYVKGEADRYRRDMIDRMTSGELMHEDSIRQIDSLRVATLRTGRMIYGGGGITPDRFVPIDTTDFTKYYRDVMAKGVPNQFVISYVEKNRKRLLKQYRNDDAFVRDFTVTPEMLAEFVEMAKGEGVEPNEEQAAQSAPLLSMIIKGLIGRDLFEQASYSKVYNGYDPIFREALRLINSDEYDTLLGNTHNRDSK